MNETIFSRIRRIFDPTLESLGPGRPLDDRVVTTLHALLQVLADDADLPRSLVESTVQRRAARDLAQMREYVAGARLLDARSRDRFGRAFAEVTLDERDQVLRGMLPDHPSPELESPLRRRLRLTSYNLHLVLSWPAHRRFRSFVVADLLSAYYTTARGWAVVGYDEFPGFVRSAAEPCVVRGLSTQGAHVVLELSDACYERLRPGTLRVDDAGRFVCKTKSGRQTAVFSREAQLELGALLDDSPDGPCLRVAGTSTRIELGDDAR